MTSDESFPKNEHLLKTKDFAIVYKKGASFRAGGMILYILPSPFGHSRLGISISSRNVKLATRRNRIKRIIREAYRKNKKYFKRDADIVSVIRKDPGKQIAYNIIADPMIKLLKEGKVIG